MHWVNAILFLVLIFTGGVLYLPSLMGLVGRRRLIVEIHTYAGLALPLPLILALCGRWGAGLKADLRRINWWTDEDRVWLRSLGRAGRPGRRRRGGGKLVLVGKFNAGQKLNAALVAGAGLVMLGSGVVLRWYGYFPYYLRSGSTFVHNWVALGLFILIVGHILFALANPASLRSMITGRVSLSWARRHAPGWLAESEGSVTLESRGGGRADGEPAGPLGDHRAESLG